MILEFEKYQGAGNDFIMIDCRSKRLELNIQQVKFLCDRYFGVGADGLILIEKCDEADFKMRYFNSDGNESTMCGNGGRCAIQFAFYLKIFQSFVKFKAIDGLHHGKVLENGLVELSMNDVTHIDEFEDGKFLDTGSPHFVRIVSGLDKMDVFKEGSKLRHDHRFGNGGTNVNFIEMIDKSQYAIRTYERGVENETLACGTGVTASAIVIASQLASGDQEIILKARGGTLKVSLYVDQSKQFFSQINLIGPATRVFKGLINLS